MIITWKNHCNRKKDAMLPTYLLPVLLSFIISTDAQQEIVELSYSVTEEQPPGTFIGNVVRDANLTSLYDSEALSRLRFRFMRLPSNVELDVDPTSGIVRTGNGRIDREAVCAARTIVCTVRADVAVQPVEYFRIVRLTVAILDVNDGVPTFTTASHDGKLSFSMPESAAVGTALPLPQAADPDSPVNSVIGYRLLTPVGAAASDRRRFRLEQDRLRDGSFDVRLVLVEPLDRELSDQHHLTVAAVDGGSPPLTGSVEVVINVIDTNDNSPRFESSEYSVTIAENTAKMTSVVQVQAVDMDIGPNGHVTYSFSTASAEIYGDLFSIDAESGQISVIGDLDRDKGTSQFRLIVIASDSGPDAVTSSATVNIELTDVNDNAPEVTSVGSLLTSSSSDSSTGTSSKLHTQDADAVVTENRKAGTFVAHLTIVDEDEGENGRFNCSLRLAPSGNGLDTNADEASATAAAAEKFHLKRIYDTEFQLLTSSALDRELRPGYNITIVCSDFGHPMMTSRRQLYVAVGDVNDHVPTFVRQRYNGELFENNYVGASIVQTMAFDADLGENSRLAYSLSGPGSEHFSVDPNSGLISAAATLDREKTGPQISFRVVASDFGTPPLVGSALVVVSVLDVNDNRPVFIVDSQSDLHGYQFEIAENQPSGTVIGRVSAVDADSGPNQSIEYRLIQSAATGAGGNEGVNSVAFFHVDPESGVVSIQEPLDREQADSHTLTVVAVDRGVPQLSATVNVLVSVVDVNDNAPQFVFPSPIGGGSASGNGGFSDRVGISTAARSGSVVTRLIAADADTGVNSRIAYGYSMTIDEVPFRVDSDSGFVIVDGDLSQLDGRKYDIVVTASDYRGLSTSTILRLVVNSSLAAPLSSNEDDLASSSSSDLLIVGGNGNQRSLDDGIHFTAVICLAIGSGSVTVALVIAIAIVRRRQGCCRSGKGSSKGSPSTASVSNGARQYNCRTAANERMNQTTVPPTSSSSSVSIWNQTSRPPTAQRPPNGTPFRYLDSCRFDIEEPGTYGVGTTLSSGNKNCVTRSGSISVCRSGNGSSNDVGKCCCCAVSGENLTDCDVCGSKQRLLQNHYTQAPTKSGSMLTTTFGVNDVVTTNGVSKNNLMKGTRSMDSQPMSATMRPSFNVYPCQTTTTGHQLHSYSPIPTLYSTSMACSYQPSSNSELEVCQLLRRLQTAPGNADDAGSVHSNGDCSNTDSGRGASDDGDASAAAVAGTTFRGTSSTQPPRLQTQQLTNRNVELNKPLPGNCSFYPTISRASASEKNTTSPPEVRPLLSDATLSRSGSDRNYSRSQPRFNVHEPKVIGGRTVSSPAHSYGKNDAAEEDDAATTTSGSYVVDARELCNEIDQTFFNEDV